MMFGAVGPRRVVIMGVQCHLDATLRQTPQKGVNVLGVTT